MPQRSSSGRGSAAGRTGNQAREVNEAELSRLKVDELRERLRARGVTGTSALRKDELVKSLVKSLREEHKGGGSRSSDKKTTPARGRTASAKKTQGVRAGSSKSVEYSQEITSTGQEPERPGRSLVTTDHDVIQRWAQERDAVPATVEGTEHGDHLGVLRFDFPGGSESGRLREVSWEEWFDTFDQRGLNFIYQEQRSDGTQSNFFQLENPDREDA
ncbi:MAG: hypothetical protein AUG44_09190 [Actinobacteria bacterium 13_1_20CM_3_71_11]|nr:MAG: hypothetical protein AUG44_09190 [Actinobacteria bacterium 13_1_20CM_3_71_11]